ncbi:MAG: ATP-dependent RecD-like DNA helicase [Anaerolineales bacterium]|nr:ATP-dependent RecD-like DNA helicase [Anaerolineales bacterium]
MGWGMIRGGGRVMAERIVNRFGAETLDVIDEQPERLQEVLGIGKQRIRGIVKAWAEQRAIRDVMVFLQAHGVSTGLAVKIYKQYGDQSLAVVQSTPYKLVNDVAGIGFITADKIARALGLAHDDPNRIEAGIAYTLNRMADEGHVYVPQTELEPQASEILGVAAEQVTAVIDQLTSNNFIQRDTLTYEISQPDAIKTVQEEKAVYLTPFFYSEVGATKRIQQIISHPTSRLASIRNGQSPISNLQSTINLAPQQLEAIKTAVSHKVTVLTGGPGTGKTTTLRALLDLLDRYHHTYLLASPTGRAAKRLAEATGREAKTIHRLLEFNPGEGFGRDQNNLLDADMIIIDEASMLDLVLANTLLKAVGNDSHLLLVGDVDQLPSVGAGDVLRDLIASGKTAVIRLQTIFRQAADSLIIHNAHRINQGLMPETPPEGKDFFIFVKPDMEETAELLVDIVKNRVPDKFHLDPLDDIQVLAPMYNGLVGVTQLNEALQEALNPGNGRKPERRLGGRVFRVGDKVMQTVNNYDKNVYNGDIGRIVGLDILQQTITVSIDGNPVVYDFLEADELVHAFAISVHKSQGAEYPCVVIPMVMQHYMMLQRNLLYTAVTRAKKLAILVGTRRAIHIAVKNDKVTQRHTALDWRLQHQ